MNIGTNLGRIINMIHKKIISYSITCLIVATSAFLISFDDVQASVILRIRGTNPSEQEEQKVVIQIYLPKEVRPEHILDKDDLEILYDSQQDTYYVYQEYQVGAGEYIEREIEIEDIWFIPEELLNSLRKRANSYFSLLEDSNFREKAYNLKISIEAKIDEIVESQKIPSINPDKHILRYHINLRLLEAINSELKTLQSLLSQARLLSAMAIWKIFFAIVGFLAIIALSFYVVWQKQAKSLFKPAIDKSKKDDEDIIEPDRHDVKGEKEIEVDEIEDIMKKDRLDKEE